MTLLQLKRAVLAELGGRNLKNPAIRANALEKICTFIIIRSFEYLSDNNVGLPSDKDILKKKYEFYKNQKINNAESSIINEIYKHYEREKHIYD